MDLQTTRHQGHAFERDYPTADAAESIQAEQDLHRAVEAYRFFYPTVSMEGIFNGNRERGIEDGKGIMLLAAGPRHVVLTANSDTPYAGGVLDLAAMGPVVVELPRGPYVGLVNDHYHRWVLDMGIPGPDGGEGGRYLVLPPDFAGVIPSGYHVARALTQKVLLAMRAIPGEGGVAAAMEAIRRVRVHSLDAPAAVLPYVDLSRDTLDATALRWEGNLEFWRRLHAIIDSEPALDEYRPMYGELAALGIEKGKPFAPRRQIQEILTVAARAALEEMCVEAFASQRADARIWRDRRWEWAILASDANYETEAYLDLEARDRFFYQAVVASPAMTRRVVGGGSIYFLCARDHTGAFLDGSRTYKLTVPQPVPATLFWSITAYDARTRSQVQTAQDKAVLGSLHDKLQPNPDGTLELYFGPRAPKAKERQWIQTIPGKGFFLYFRIYGPQAAALDGRWRLDDMVALETPLRDVPSGPQITDDTVRSISTVDVVDSRIGRLRFNAGVPTAATAAVLYDNLDHLHAVEAFLNSFQAVSVYAIRKGFQVAGVRDNDVLLFSRLMDARSLFLTADCDTLYFLSILGLSHGPVVVEVPPRVLCVLDDMWFRWISDIGLAGPDRGEGGRYLVVPPGYAGPLPEGGFVVCRSSTNHALLLGRAFLENGDPAPAAARIKRGVKIHRYAPGGQGTSIGAFLRGDAPLAAPSEPPPTRFVEGSGLTINTIPPSDVSYFDMLDAVVQLEPASALDPELAGQFASLGIVKGQRFRPDGRMKRILRDAVAVANATARTLALCPRNPAVYFYGETSKWMNPLLVSGYDFQRPPPRVGDHGLENAPDSGARLLDARTAFFYLATGITPAMCMWLTGVGSQYLGINADAAGAPLDGSKYYRVRLPPNIPAGLFWSLTAYDNQTRSMVQTEQRFPRAGGQSCPTPAAVPGEDGSITIHIAPTRPQGAQPGNWIQTAPGRGWFLGLRLYSPLASFFDKSWRPSEVEPWQ